MYLIFQREKKTPSVKEAAEAIFQKAHQKIRKN